MKSALIQCGDHFENQTRILPLALHLEALGVKPVIMLYSRSCSKLFDYYGISTVYLDEFRSQAKNNLSRFPFDYEKIFFIERARAYSKYNSPAKLNKEKHKVDRDYTAISLILEEIRPHYVFIWNGFTGNVANILRTITDSSTQFESWYMERSFFNHSLFVDHEGVNAAASIAKYFDGRYDQAIPEKYTLGKGLLQEELSQSRPFSDPYVFIPLQVQTDTNNILYSPYIRKMRALVISVLDAVDSINQRLGRNIKVVVRHHPEEVDSQLNLPRHSLLYFRSDGEIRHWCAHAIGVININSTVGLEAIFLEKPVFSFGQSIYSHDTLNFNVSTESFYKRFEQFVSNELPAVEANDRDRFFSYLFYYNTCNLDNAPDCVTEKVVENDDVRRRGDAYLRDRDEEIRNYLSSKEAIRVGCFVSSRSRLNLTYRNNSLALSPDLYRKLFKNRYGYAGEIDFHLLEKPEGIEGYDFVLRDEKHENLAFSHSRVLDKYLSKVN